MWYQAGHHRLNSVIIIDPTCETLLFSFFIISLVEGDIWSFKFTQEWIIFDLKKYFLSNLVLPEIHIEFYLNKALFAMKCEFKALPIFKLYTHEWERFPFKSCSLISIFKSKTLL